jgi:hypothetical protein
VKIFKISKYLIHIILVFFCIVFHQYAIWGFFYFFGIASLGDSAREKCSKKIGFMINKKIYNSQDLNDESLKRITEDFYCPYSKIHYSVTFDKERRSFCLYCPFHRIGHTFGASNEIIEKYPELFEEAKNDYPELFDE